MVWLCGLISGDTGTPFEVHLTGAVLWQATGRAGDERGSYRVRDLVARADLHTCDQGTVLSSSCPPIAVRSEAQGRSVKVSLAGDGASLLYRVTPV